MTDKSSKPKLIVVLGPTAVGKSDFAVSLAREFDGEIISADSRQVYRGVDLMTGAVKGNETSGIPHHLLRIRDLSDPYSVTDFVKDAERSVNNIIARGKTPIVCGGTAMYIDALVYNQIFPKVLPDERLRSQLAEKSTAELYKILIDLDPVRASTIDTQNPRRLIRAIEIATALGKVPEITHEDSVYETLLIGLDLPKAILHDRIQARIDNRMSAGMLNEITALHDSGLSYDYIRTFGLEFKALPDIAENKKTQDQALEELYFDIIHFAKRQMTWWKRNKDIHWFNPNDDKNIIELVNNFMQK